MAFGFFKGRPYAASMALVEIQRMDPELVIQKLADLGIQHWLAYAVAKYGDPVRDTWESLKKKKKGKEEEEKPVVFEGVTGDVLFER